MLNTHSNWTQFGLNTGELINRALCTPGPAERVDKARRCPPHRRGGRRSPQSRQFVCEVWGFAVSCPSFTEQLHPCRPLGKADVVQCQTVTHAFSSKCIPGKRRGSLLRARPPGFSLSELLSWEDGMVGSSCSARRCNKNSSGRRNARRRCLFSKPLAALCKLCPALLAPLPS